MWAVDLWRSIWESLKDKREVRFRYCEGIYWEILVNSESGISGIGIYEYRMGIKKLDGLCRKVNCGV